MDMIFLEHPHWKHLDVKLLHLGENGKYCLVERLLPEAVGAEWNKCMLRLTMFIVKYGEDGELRVKLHALANATKSPN
jgi:hypothetical protein